MPIMVGRMSASASNVSTCRLHAAAGARERRLDAQRDVPGSVGTHFESTSTSFLMSWVTFSPVKVCEGGRQHEPIDESKRTRTHREGEASCRAVHALHVLRARRRGSAGLLAPLEPAETTHLVGPEQPRDAVLALVRLEALEERRSVVEDGRGGVELERRVRLDLWRAPAGLRVPGDREHCEEERQQSVHVAGERQDALWSVKVRPNTSWLVGGIVLGLLVSSTSSRDGCARARRPSSALRFVLWAALLRSDPVPPLPLVIPAARSSAQPPRTVPATHAKLLQRVQLHRALALDTRPGPSVPSPLISTARSDESQGGREDSRRCLRCG